MSCILVNVSLQMSAFVTKWHIFSYGGSFLLRMKRALVQYLGRYKLLFINKTRAQLYTVYIASSYPLPVIVLILWLTWISFWGLSIRSGFKSIIQGVIEMYVYFWRDHVYLFLTILWNSLYYRNIHKSISIKILIFFK